MSTEWKKGWTDAEIAQLRLSCPENTEVIGGVVVPTVSKQDLSLMAQRYPKQFAPFMRGEPSAAAMADALDEQLQAPRRGELRARYPSMG
jgi:hypothetical protein